MQTRSWGAVRAVALAGLLLGAVAVRCEAAPATPQLLQIVGHVTHPSGRGLVQGDLVFRVYGQATGGEPLHGSGGDFLAAIQDSLFDVTLGAVTPLALDDADSCYLEMDVNGETIIGEANGGRYVFLPGNGSHARPDLERRLDSLEVVLGIARPAAPTTAAGATSRPPTRDSHLAARPKSRSESPSVLREGILGAGASKGQTSQYRLDGTFLFQPIGRFASASYRARLGPVYTWLVSVADVPGVDSDVPRQLRLRASPTPFVARTTFLLDLPESVPVALRVFDVAGRVVRVLSRGGALGPGTCALAWDGADDGGAPVPPGLYLCRMTAGSRSQTVRVLRLH
jgi:hypothetical protein